MKNKFSQTGYANLKNGARKSASIQKERKNERIREYQKSPSLCSRCNKKLPYEKRGNKFCSQSCAAKVNNLGVQRNLTTGHRAKKQCLNCGKETTNKLYCSNNCHKEYVWQKIKEDIEVNGFANLAPHSNARKRYLIETRGLQCEICGITEWMKQEVPLVMDHINGNSDDNNLSNLRLICHNCDAQTPTYKSRNRGNGRHSRRERYKAGKSY